MLVMERLKITLETETGRALLMRRAKISNKVFRLKIFGKGEKSISHRSNIIWYSLVRTKKDEVPHTRTFVIHKLANWILELNKGKGRQDCTFFGLVGSRRIPWSCRDFRNLSIVSGLIDPSVARHSSEEVSNNQ